ncbi:hypothetical protein [Shewanella sp.]|uniref:hypothetical protein n=1 Tax=Shewanella sp. TaxID=50422 RepID=UPI000EC90D20|nr:hypothetical protein [Shewanella sp.]HCD12290.1 hypothetical protein [Shewanella sp.]
MALPLLWLGSAALGAVWLADEQQKRKKIAQNRVLMDMSVQRVKGRARLTPSEWFHSQSVKQVQPGMLVCCHVFGIIEHTGIWLGDGTLAELHGSGLVRPVSVRRFLAGRSGSKVFVACDHQRMPLVSEQALVRAGESLFQYRDYDLFDNNCHRYVWHCISGKPQRVSSFLRLNQLLEDFFGQGVYWDQLPLESFGDE